MQKTNLNTASNQSITLISDILQKLSGLSKSRQNFLVHILMLMLSLPRRHNFSQMAHYGKYHEKTYRRHFEESFDWLSFNTMVRTFFNNILLICF